MRAPRWRRRQAVQVLALTIAGVCAATAMPAASLASPAVVASDAGAAGAKAACTKAAITKAITAAGKAQKVPAKLVKKQFKCAGGWAYADANLGKGAEAVTVTFVFKAAGPTWALKNRAKVCNAPGNQVPAAIFKLACTTN
jgi:hypothetical protein